MERVRLAVLSRLWICMPYEPGYPVISHAVFAILDERVLAGFRDCEKK